MTKFRFTPRRIPDIPCEPFLDAEQAWFWFMRSQRVRGEGARLMKNPMGIVRPCDPDDLYRAVMGLLRRRTIGREHIRVLAMFGIEEIAPDPRIREQERACRLWDEALDRLTTVLKGKGIVE